MLLSAVIVEFEEYLQFLINKGYYKEMKQICEFTH